MVKTTDQFWFYYQANRPANQNLSLIQRTGTCQLFQQIRTSQHLKQSGTCQLLCSRSEPVSTYSSLVLVSSYLCSRSEPVSSYNSLVLVSSYLCSRSEPASTYSSLVLVSSYVADQNLSAVIAVWYLSALMQQIRTCQHLQQYGTCQLSFMQQISPCQF